MKFNNLKNIIPLFFLLLIAVNYSYGQPANNETKLAAYYYDKGEFDKAEPYYEKLYKQYKSKNYFQRYFMCLFYQTLLPESQLLKILFSADKTKSAFHYNNLGQDFFEHDSIAELSTFQFYHDLLQNLWYV